MTTTKRDNAEAPAPRRILIVGGGTAGWMAANLFIRRWADGLAGRPVAVTVVEAPDIGIIGVGEGSTPQLKAFFDGLGVAEADWMQRCNATYKNGISFHRWSDAPGCESYFHPFPSVIDAHTSPAFFYNSHFRRQGADLWGHPDRYFLSAELARQRLAPIPAESFPFDMAYGYHFDAYLVGAYLRDLATSRGVIHREGKVARVGLSADGDIADLQMEGGETLEADLFVDATGFRSVLLQDALGVPFVSFAENLFNDAAVALPTPLEAGGLAAETQAVAMKYGWRWRIPLTNRYGNGYVYSSRYCSADEAEAELRADLGLTDSDVAARHLKMKVGRVDRHWARNCLAVGLSQGFIEPLEATALHLVQATVEGFIDAYERHGAGPGLRDAFNADINARFEGVRDYIVCHYKVNQRRDTDYWRDNAANENLSASLRGVLDCWRAGGDLKQEIARQDIARYYSLTSWAALLGGYGTYPPNLHPPHPEHRRFDLATIDEFVRRAALNFRPHGDAIAELASN